MSKRFNVRALVFCSLLILSFMAASPAAHAQDKVYGPYWAWPNQFGGNKFTSFTFGNGSTPSWDANYDFPNFGLVGYPAACRGYHYGYNPSGDTLFPKQMRTITHIPAAFSYYTAGTNMNGDWTYDMFLRKDTDVKSGQSNPQLEVMIWGNNASSPIGKVIVTDALTTNGVTYDLWFGYNDAAKYYTYSFKPHGTTPATIPLGNGSINVDIRDFFNVLKGLTGDNQEYSEYDYLDVVEAGIEVTRGDGVAKLTYFTLDAY